MELEVDMKWLPGAWAVDALALVAPFQLSLRQCLLLSTDKSWFFIPKDSLIAVREPDPGCEEEGEAEL